jgi:CRP/FNR family transcriptional regulator, cyclic AMP receptor protein
MSVSNSSTIATLLATTDLFGQLNPTDRERVAERMRPATFKSGQLIFSGGDDARDLYLVQSGRVRLSMLSADGREIALAHATDGGVFGEIAVLDHGKRTANATAISAVTALSLSRPALVELMEKTPSVAQAAIRFLCRRLRDTDQKFEAIALHPIEVRLARFLLSAIFLEAPAGAKDGAKNLKNGKWPLTVGMSQAEVALLVGASRPKVNSAFAQLEDIGAITREGTKVHCDIALLKDIAVSE